MICQICNKPGLKEASAKQAKARVTVVCSNEYIVHFKTSQGHFLFKRNALEEIMDTADQKHLILN